MPPQNIVDINLDIPNIKPISVSGDLENIKPVQIVKLEN